MRFEINAEVRDGLSEAPPVVVEGDIEQALDTVREEADVFEGVGATITIVRVA